MSRPGHADSLTLVEPELEGEEDEQIVKLYGNTEMSFLTTTAITSITSYNNDKF